MRPETLKRFAAPVPRYTSYPTAPHFSDQVDANVYRSWLAAIPDGATVSLYIHIPYCEQLCWYCGCTTKITQRYAPVSKYVDVLLKEIEAVGAMMQGRHAVTHLHFGGGSPSILAPDDIGRITDALRSAFTFAEDMDYAVEVDPRTLCKDRIAAFAKAGMSRVSMGVQDFAEDVQKAINRLQSYEMTRDVVESFRAHGVASTNVDLVYGLPLQTLDSVKKTIAQVITIKPDRIALFGYAHLPSRITHQKLIPDETLPDAETRYQMANAAAEALLRAGYKRVGLDHFALPHDDLVTGEVNRNFQGYTSDDAESLIGLGASSIGRLKQGYVQNEVAIPGYTRMVEETGLATARGHALTSDDEMRSFVIERLMCDFRFPTAELKRRYGSLSDSVMNEARTIVANDADGILLQDDDGVGFEIAQEGRLFVRTICAAFDSYLGAGTAKHSSGV